jgi:phospholipase/carboxylesterase
VKLHWPDLLCATAGRAGRISKWLVCLTLLYAADDVVAADTVVKDERQIPPVAQSPGNNAHVPGVQFLDERGARGSLLFVPETLAASPSTPLLVMLHGFGESGRDALDLVRSIAAREGVIVFAPSSRDNTWDMIATRRFGRDVKAIQDELTVLLAEYAIDSSKVAIGGFSDGASYALSVGISNGSLFRVILAFSPGFMAVNSGADKPRVFISHGVRDQIFPIGRGSRALVPRIRQMNMQVNYVEFAGGHVVPADIVEQAFTWFLHPPR